MILDNILICAGKKKEFTIPVPGERPLKGIAVYGRRPGKTLVITAGVHGCEYVGILAARDFAAELNPEELRGNVIILPLVNDSGFFHGLKQIVPEDGKNLNREFPGDIAGTYTQRIAAVIEREVYPIAEFLIDLHGGDCNEALSPLVFFPVAVSEHIVEQVRAAAMSLSVPLRVASTAKNGLYSWAAQKGIPALLLERGCRGRWSPEEVKADKNDLRQILIHLGILDGAAPSAKQKEIRQAVYTEAQISGFWYPVVTEGTTIQKGQLLGELRDLDGNLTESYRAEFDGIVMYYTFSLGVQAGDTLIAYGR